MEWCKCIADPSISFLSNCCLPQARTSHHFHLSIFATENVILYEQSTNSNRDHPFQCPSTILTTRSLYRAGSAAIVKGISIKNITNIEDNTYAMANLNIWVFTEMWFVIIFGSIPTLRKVFIQFSRDIGSAIMHRDIEQRPQNNMEDWAQLRELSESGERERCESALGQFLPSSACSDGAR